MKTLSRILGVCFVVVPLTALWSPSASAFGGFDDGGGAGLPDCATCHADLANKGPDHDTHGALSNDDCASCHGGGPRDDPPLDLCMRCHGRDADGNPSADFTAGLGRGLRQHHVTVGAAACGNCHTDTVNGVTGSAAENVLPSFYPLALEGTGLDPCDGSEENFPSRSTSLDNDGDGLTDGADADCVSDPTPVAAVDLAGISDVTGDGLADFVSLIDVGSGAPEVQVMSGGNGSSFKSIQYLNSLWDEMRIEAVADGNSDGVADDPAVALLARNPANSETIVQTRLVSTGANIRNIKFFNPAWTALDLMVINDENADGVTGDTVIGVLAVNPATDKIGVQLRRLSNGSVVVTRYFLNPAWDAVAVDVVERLGMTPLIGVIATNAINRTVVQSRQLSDGSVQANTYYLNTDWLGRDVTVEYDGNGDEVANDPAWLVLATNAATAKNVVQARAVTGGTVIKNIFFLNPFWTATAADSSGDISGNTVGEVGVTARHNVNSKDVIQVRDYLTENLTRNIYP